MKKLFSFVPVLLLALVIFAGCAKQENAPVTVWLPTKMTVLDNAGAVSGENTYTYDETGNLAQIDGTTTGSTPWRETFAYTEQGQVKEKSHYSDGKLFYSTGYEYSYDIAGRLVAWTTLDLMLDVETCRCDYTYDASGNNTITTTQYNGGSITRCIYEYDENGNTTRQTTYVGEEVTDDFTYTYDEAGRMTEESHFSSDGTERIRNNWYYNEVGQLINQTVSYQGTTTDVHVYTYNEKGLLKTHSYQTFGVERWRKEYTYNENGCCIRLVSQEENQVYTSTYEYAAFTVTPQQAQRLDEYLDTQFGF